MSLICWMPLNGDLRNQGLGEMVQIQGTPSWCDEGKIGNQSFNLASNTVYFSCEQLINTRNYTMMCWCKIEDNTSNNSDNWIKIIQLQDQTANNANGIIRFESCYGSAKRFASWHDNATNASYTGSKTFATYEEWGNWHHLALSFDETKAYTYLDGELISTLSGNRGDGHLTGNWIGIGGGTNQKGCLNDFRVYNHCLSQKEIREIAKGLVLHYKLDGFMGGANENIILTSNKVTSGSQGANITREYMIDGSLKIIAGTSNGNYASIGFQNNSNTNVGAKMYVGDIYTISCDIKVESGTQLPKLFINSGNGYKQLQGTIILNQWIRAYYTSTWAEPGTNYGNISLHLGFSSAIGTYYFKNFKLEKGSNPTLWTPAPEDLRIDTTIIEDSSGYNNHGIINDSSAQYVIDSARYNQAIKNSQSNNSSTYLIKGECNMPDSDALTFSWWMNPTTFGYQISGLFSTSNSNASDHGTTAANMRDSCFDCCNTSGTDVRINVANYLTLNEWHHYALTYNGSQLNFYKDGVSKVTANQTGALKAFKYIYLFYSCAGGAHRCTSGQLSDFRIYCTALSAEDIKELYQTSSSIDDKQNYYTRELINNNKISITQTGITFADSFEEDEIVEFKDTNVIKSMSFYEY